MSVSHDGATTLCLWQVEQDLSCKELAAKIGCSRESITRFRGRRCKPGRKLAVALERVTEGRVRVESWGE